MKKLQTISEAPQASSSKSLDEEELSSEITADDKHLLNLLAELRSNSPSSVAAVVGENSNIRSFIDWSYAPVYDIFNEDYVDFTCKESIAADNLGAKRDAAEVAAGKSVEDQFASINRSKITTTPNALGSTVESKLDAPDVDFSADFIRLNHSIVRNNFEMARGIERERIVPFDFLRLYSSEDAAQDRQLVQHQRSVIVIRIIELRSGTLFLGVSILDRFLSKGFFRTEELLQLLGVACLALAINIEEVNKDDWKSMLTGDMFEGEFDKIFPWVSISHKGRVVAMAQLVQKNLGNRCLAPTIYDFLWYYLKAANVDEVVLNKTKILAVSSLMSVDLLRYWPSTVAAALVMAAAERDDISQLVSMIHAPEKDDLGRCLNNMPNI